MRPVHAFLFLKVEFEKFLYFALKEGILSICILYLTFLFFNSSILIAQVPEFQCGTTEYMNQILKNNPELKDKINYHEQLLKEKLNSGFFQDTLGIITIPVVVHIVYNTDEQNLPDIRVFEQIEMLNRDFSGLRTQSMGAFSDSLKANTGIQFCLARKAPDGYPTNGIERRFTTDTAFGFNNAVKFYKYGGLDAWDPSKYLNIWVCNLNIGGSGGYSQFPGIGNNETFGAVIYYIYFGGTGARPIYNMGGMTTHELGHCFNLHHIWGDDNGTCEGTDYCADTPNQANATTKFHSGILTDYCSPISPGIMYMNFMDYSYDSVYANFTPDQTARMRACFDADIGPLYSLLSSDACIPPTGIETENNFQKKIIISPNPANDYIEISGVSGEVKIFDILGREVWRGKVFENSKIDVSEFVDGVYILITSDRLQSANFLIMK